MLICDVDDFAAKRRRATVRIVVLSLVVFTSFVFTGSQSWSQAFAFSEDIILEPLQPVTRVTPGEAATFGVRIENLGNEAEELEFEVDLPTGWRMLIPPDPFLALQSGESAVLLLTIAVPIDAVPGDTKVRLITRDTAWMREVETDFIASVQGHAIIDMRVVEQPELTNGDAYDIRFLVINSGNIPHELLFRAQPTRDYAFQVTPNQINLAPDEQVEVVVHARPGRQAQRTPGLQSIQLLAIERETQSVIGRSIARVEVVPKRLSSLGAFHTFPLRLELTWRDWADDASVQWQLVGRGSLSDTDPGTLRVRFRDEYQFAEYETNDWRIAGGHQRVFLSPLTENRGMEGFGFELEQYGTPVNWQAFTFSDQSREISRSGGRLTFYYNDENSNIGVNFVSRPDESGDLWSIRAAHDGIDNWSIDSELGWQTSDSFPMAFSLSGQYIADQMAAQLEYRQEDDGFRDRSDARRSLRGLISQALGDKHIVARSVLSQTYRGSFSDERLSTSWRSTATLSGNHDEWRWSGRYGLNVRWQDSQPGAQTRHRFDGWWRRSLAERRSIDHRAHLEFGDGSAHDTSIGYSVGYSTPAGRGTARLSTSILHFFEPERDDRISASIGWHGRLGQNTTVSATLSAFNILSNEYRASGRLGYTTSEGHRFTFSAEHRWNFYGDDETLVRIGYVIPFDLPVSYRSDVGSLKGQVVDDQGEGIPDVVLRLGALSVMTDEEGRFEFPAVTEGTYTLSLAGGNLPSNAVTEPPEPIRVLVEAGTTVETHITVREGSGIRGVLEVVPVPEDMAARDDLMFGPRLLSPAGMRVTLTDNDGRTRSAIIGSDGRFMRDRLEPGSWILSIDTQMLPRGYAAEPATQVVEIQAGDIAETMIRLVPVPRQIHFIDEQEL